MLNNLTSSNTHWYTTMVIWTLLLWKMSLVTDVSPQFIQCPREGGHYYATSPDCLFYYRCENRFFKVQVCYPWQRFDIHTLRCRKRFEVDCNPMYAAIWRPMFDRPGLVGEETGEGLLESGGEPINEGVIENPPEKQTANTELAGESPLFAQQIPQDSEVGGQEPIIGEGSAELNEPSNEVALDNSLGEGLENDKLVEETALTGQGLAEESGMAGNKESSNAEERREPVHVVTGENSELAKESSSFGQEIPEESKIPGEGEIEAVEGSSVEIHTGGDEQINQPTKENSSEKGVENGEKAGERSFDEGEPGEVEMIEQEKAGKADGSLLGNDTLEDKSPGVDKIQEAQEPATNGDIPNSERPETGIENHTSSKQENPSPMTNVIDESEDQNPKAAQENDIKSASEKPTIGSSIFETPLESLETKVNGKSQTDQLEPEKEMNEIININDESPSKENEMANSKSTTVEDSSERMTSHNLLKDTSAVEIPATVTEVERPTEENIKFEVESPTLEEAVKENEIADSKSTTVDDSSERMTSHNLPKDTSVLEIPATVTEVERPAEENIKFEVESPTLEEAVKGNNAAGETGLQTQSTLGEKNLSPMSNTDSEENTSVPSDFSKSEAPVRNSPELEKIFSAGKSVEDKDSSSAKNLREIRSITKKRSADASACSDGNELLVFPEPESNVSENLTNENKLPFGVPSSTTNIPNVAQSSQNFIGENQLPSRVPVTSNARPNAGESSSQNTNSLQQLINSPADTGDTPSGMIWYWCGSGRFVLAQNSEEGNSICLQLQDPESIDEEGKVQPGGDWAGHTFLGTNNEFD